MVDEITMTDCIDLDIVHSIRQLGECSSNGHFVQELYELFSTHSLRLTRELKEAVERSDRSEVRQLAHKLRGTAANIGAVELSKYAAAIENLARGEFDPGQLTDAVSHLEKIQVRAAEEIRSALNIDNSSPLRKLTPNKS